MCSEKIDQTLHVAIKGRKNPIKVHAFTKWRPEGPYIVYQGRPMSQLVMGYSKSII